MPYSHTSSQSETIGPVNFCWPWVCVSEMFARATIWVLRTCLNIFICYAHSNCLRFKAWPTTIGETTTIISSTTTAATITKSTKSSTNIWKFKFGKRKTTPSCIFYRYSMLEVCKYITMGRPRSGFLSCPTQSESVLVCADMGMYTLYEHS